jgi:hypothetical protein
MIRNSLLTNGIAAWLEDPGIAAGIRDLFHKYGPPLDS